MGNVRFNKAGMGFLKTKKRFRNRDDAPPTSGESPILSINKGAEKPKSMPGKDLNDHFRLTPKDPHMRYRTPFGDLTMKEIVSEFIQKYDYEGRVVALFEITGSRTGLGKPYKIGSQEAPIEVRIANMDNILKDSRAKDDEWLSKRVDSFAYGVAAHKNRGGSYQIVAMTNAYAEYITWERIGGEIVHYEPDEKPFEPFEHPEHLGKACYDYNGKVVPWSFSSTLELKLTVWDQLFIDGVATINTSSRNDISEMSDVLFRYAKDCVTFGIDMSQLKFNLFRSMRKIKKVNYDKKMTPAEQRDNKIEGDHGMAILHITQESKMMLEGRRKNRQLMLASSSTLDETNEMLGLGSSPSTRYIPAQTTNNIVLPHENVPPQKKRMVHKPKPQPKMAKARQEPVKKAVETKPKKSVDSKPKKAKPRKAAVKEEVVVDDEDIVEGVIEEVSVGTVDQGLVDAIVGGRDIRAVCTELMRAGFAKHVGDGMTQFGLKLKIRKLPVKRHDRIETVARAILCLENPSYNGGEPDSDVATRYSELMGAMMNLSGDKFD